MISFIYSSSLILAIWWVLIFSWMGIMTKTPNWPALWLYQTRLYSCSLFAKFLAQSTAVLFSFVIRIVQFADDIVYISNIEFTRFKTHIIIWKSIRNLIIMQGLKENASTSVLKKWPHLQTLARLGSIAELTVYLSQF